jgi:hypothetical protein
MRKRRAAPQVRRYAFTIEVGGTTYECERTVTGTNGLTQRIHVHGKGSKSDSATYGLHGHPVSMMESLARIIALEIIQGDL